MQWMLQKYIKKQVIAIICEFHTEEHKKEPELELRKFIDAF